MISKKTLLFCVLMHIIHAHSTESAPMLSFLNPLIEKSIEVASLWYESIYYKQPSRKASFASQENARIPLMAHVTNMAMLLADAEWDKETIAASYLSYALSMPNKFNKALYYENLVESFGSDVANLVKDVTEVQIEDNNQRAVWRKKKEQHIEKLSHATDQAIAIMLADKIHELWSINRGLEEGKHLKEMNIRTEITDLQWFFEEALNVSYAYHDVRLRKLRLALRSEINHFCELVRIPTKKQLSRQKKKEEAKKSAEVQDVEQSSTTQNIN
jgi:(p)ppGpp synthase/HD superfamily hydrolase